MHTSSFDFHLPSHLIAQTPLPARDSCRLLCLNRKTGVRVHRRFSDLPLLLRKGDLLVLNDTRVIPARLLGRKATGGHVETLLIRQLDSDRWLVLTRPGLVIGQTARFDRGLIATVEGLAEDGQRVVRFNRSGAELDDIIHQIGTMPVPPYVKSQPANPEDYQTVFAREEGSVAAPTAGLHFTTELLEELSRHGIDLAYVTLHVGIGTFRPVKVDDVSQHHMHAETFQVSPAAADAINATRAFGRRVVAVGTTVVRVLESIADSSGQVAPASGETSLFILPGHVFRVVDAVITNFHLPRSTLLMLVSAFAERNQILDAYHEAIERGYRFFSFGDAMFIE